MNQAPEFNKHRKCYFSQILSNPHRTELFRHTRAVCALGRQRHGRGALTVFFYYSCLKLILS